MSGDELFSGTLTAAAERLTRSLADPVTSTVAADDWWSTLRLVHGDNTFEIVGNLTSSAVLDVIVGQHQRRYGQAAAANPMLSTRAQTLMVEQRMHVETLAGNPGLTCEHQRLLADVHSARAALGRNRQLCWSVAVHLFIEGDSTVRNELSRNVELRKVAERLHSGNIVHLDGFDDHLDDANLAVFVEYIRRIDIGRSGHEPAGVVLTGGDPRGGVRARRQAAHSSTLERAQLEQLAVDRDAGVRILIAARPDVDDHLAGILLNDRNRTVRDTVLRNNAGHLDRRRLPLRQLTCNPFPPVTTAVHVDRVLDLIAAVSVQPALTVADYARINS